MCNATLYTGKKKQIKNSLIFSKNIANAKDKVRNVFCGLNGWKEINGGASHWNQILVFLMGRHGQN